MIACPLACDDSPSSPTSHAPSNDAGSGSDGGAGDTQAGGATGLPEGVPTGPQCNGAPALCAVSYASLSFLGTHLSMASSKAWATRTQGRSVLDQLLVGGVRVLELEVHEDQGALSLCAGACADGNQSLAAALREIMGFLKDNPRDVLTLVLRSAVPAEALSATFEHEGVSALAHSQKQGQSWPTLQQLIDTNQRVIAFIDEIPPDVPASGAQGGAGGSSGASADGADHGVGADTGGDAAGSGGARPAWLHPLADWVWETEPSEGTNCVIARGKASLPLAILNHYVTGEAADDALIAAHDADRVAARLQRCQDDRGHTPNIVFVDFAEVGDPNGGTQIANGVR